MGSKGTPVASDSARDVLSRATSAGRQKCDGGCQREHQRRFGDGAPFDDGGAAIGVGGEAEDIAAGVDGLRLGVDVAGCEKLLQVDEGTGGA